MTTKAEREWMGRVARLPCACCGTYDGSQVHHIRDGMGMSQRASNWLTAPLCEGCHTGQYGVHGDKSRMRARKQSELDWLADTIQKLA